MLVDDRALNEGAARIEALLREIDNFPDAGLRSRAEEVVQGLLALYGEGLARMLEIIARRPNEGPGILEGLVADELISHLLLLHDLHPVPLEERISRALEEVRPYLQSHGGNVEFLGVEDGVAYLRLEGSCHSCPSSTATLKLAIEEAILRHAPDLERIEAEGVAAPPQRGTFIPLGDLRPPDGTPGLPRWVTVDGLLPAMDGEARVLPMGGASILICQLDGTYYAYGTTCPACGETLGDGALHGVAFSCAACGHRFDIRRAGRDLDAPHLQLEPIPLLARDGKLRIALEASSVGAPRR
jgi:Fe-S cluster biogenesis protein NfuA/nitrite reductase/ring-hydroxylating ferredoxin subunit